MTFAVRLGIHSQLDYGFRIKLTPMSTAVPLRENISFSLSPFPFPMACGIELKRDKQRQ
jgi:hypothetical protein